MSMIGNLRRASEARIAALLAEPESIVDYLEDEGGDPDDANAFADLCVDKAWHGIHFLLTGTAWEGEPPLDFMVRGGTEVGDVDLGYGPARTFTNAELRAIADALAPLSREVIGRRFDPAAMRRLDIYPTLWDRPREEDDTLEYLLVTYDSLRDFIEGGAKAGEGLIVFIT